MITKKLQFIWINSPIPQWVQNNIDTFRQPGWEIVIHTDDSLLNPLYVKSYKNCGLIPLKSDLLRYSILQASPGWYCDADARCFGDLNALYDLITDEPGKIWTSSNGMQMVNWFLGCDETFDWSGVNDWITTWSVPAHPAWFGAYLWFMNGTNVKQFPWNKISIGKTDVSIVAHGYKGE